MMSPLLFIEISINSLLCVSKYGCVNLMYKLNIYKFDKTWYVPISRYTGTYQV